METSQKQNGKSLLQSCKNQCEKSKPKSIQGIKAGILAANRVQNQKRIALEDKFSGYEHAGDWASKERLWRGQPFPYVRLEPWTPFLIDRHPSRLVRKPRKVVFSENVINIVFEKMVKNKYAHILHTFQQHEVAESFSYQRYGDAISNSVQLSEALRKDGVKRKSFEFYPGCEQFLYIQGTYQARKTTVAGAGTVSYAVTGVIFDERQDQDLSVRSIIEKAMGFEIGKMSVTGGTSRTPGNPLELEYQQSDRKVCLYKCPKCGHWNYPRIKMKGREWFCENIEVLDELIEDEFGQPCRHIMVCAKCRHNIDHYRGRYGIQDDGGKIQWVSQGIGKDQKPYLDYYSGYDFTRFEVGFWPLSHTIKEVEDINQRLREIFNEVLGLPYAGEDSPFPIEQLQAHYVPKLSMEDARRLPFVLMVGSVDWGDAPGSYVYCEGILSDGRSVSLGWDCMQGDELEHGHMAAAWFKGFQKRDIPFYFLCDSGYSLGREKHLRKIFGTDCVYVVTYKTKYEKDYDEARKIDPKKLEQMEIHIDRNFAVENLMNQMIRQTDYWIIPYQNPGLVDPYTLMFTNVYKVDPEKERSVLLIEIKKTDYRYARAGPDHTVHNKIYASLVQHPDLKNIFYSKVSLI